MLQEINETGLSESRALMRKIDKFTSDMAEYKYFQLIILFDSFRDRIVSDNEIAEWLDKEEISYREALAITIVQDFATRFNNIFAIGTDRRDDLFEGLVWTNWFSSQFGKAIQALLRPNDLYANDGKGFEGHLEFAHINLLQAVKFFSQREKKA